MSVEHYRQAISLLEWDGRLNKRRFPQNNDAIEELEADLDVNLPPSYKAMLRDFGILIYRGGEIIYGLGRDGVRGEGGSGTWFQTKMARDQKQISPTMVLIMSSGYGPEFCIECAEVLPDGESPIFLVPAEGSQAGVERVADSFGEFLLKEVKAILAD